MWAHAKKVRAQRIDFVALRSGLQPTRKADDEQSRLPADLESFFFNSWLAHTTLCAAAVYSCIPGWAVEQQRQMHGKEGGHYPICNAADGPEEG